jgi:hypothetical protein
VTWTLGCLVIGWIVVIAGLAVVVVLWRAVTS